MITAVQSCGCPSNFPPSTALPKFDQRPNSSVANQSVSQFCPPWTPSSYTSASAFSRPSTAVSNCRPQSSLSQSKRAKARQPFENPKPALSKEDEAKCPCPRIGDPRQDPMGGKCSACCAGVHPESKVVSKIVAGGKPYKEIEAVINDNRMVIRIQKESIDSEWDPPCDCADGGSPAGSRRGGRLGGGCEAGGPSRCGDNVVFQTVGNSDFGGCPSGRSDNVAGMENCRTVTVFPQLEIATNEPPRDEDGEKKDSKKERSEKTQVAPRFEDIEDNPNVFVLKIRKRSVNAEGKNNIDLEFRTPRPWMNIPKPTLKLPPQVPTTPPEPPKDQKETSKGKGNGSGKKKKKGKK